MINEARYKGNIGVMEMIKFFSMASPQQKQQMKQFLQQDDPNSAWELLQSVTGMQLEPLEFEKALTEGTDVLYHYTSVLSALKIIHSGQFELSFVVPGSIEQKYNHNKGYFLSTTRSKVGDYHSNAGSSAVMFVIDGRKLSHRHRIEPVDYWERMWNHPGSQRGREAEDRVVTDKQTIPLDVVEQIHILITEEASDTVVSGARKLAIACYKKQIPVWIYDDPNSWKMQNTKKALSGQQLVKQLSAKNLEKPWPHLASDYYVPWLQLIFGDVKQPLSKAADKKLYNLKYYSDTIGSDLGTMLHNDRKPNSKSYTEAKKIIDFMRQNRMNKLEDLRDYIVNRWKKP